jgi:hypothetical protein
MSFFSSIPLWGWIDIFSNIVVLFALCGESHWALKWLIPNKSVGKTSVKWRREKLKKKFEFLLILGIAGEVGCLPLSLKESADSNRAAGQANERAANAEKQAGEANERAARFDADRAMIAKDAEEIRSNNLALKIKLSELEIKAGKRHLTDEQKASIEHFLIGAQRGKIRFNNMAIGDDEVEGYEKELTEFFKHLGFDAERGGGLFATFPEFLGMAIGIKSQNERPSFSGAIQKAFEGAGISLPGFDGSTIADTNTIEIKIGKKPPY